jgi:hypothetical protein
MNNYEIKLTIDGEASTTQITSGQLEQASILESQIVAKNAIDVINDLPDETELLLEVTMKNDNNIRIGGIIADGTKGLALAVISAVSTSNGTTE